MKICMIWGGMGEGSGDFPTVILYEVGACADLGIFAGGGVQARLPENSSDNFLVLNFTEGVQWLFQTKL